MAMDNRGAPGLDYAAFKSQLSNENFIGPQNALLGIRLGLLESFMDLPGTVEIATGSFVKHFNQRQSKKAGFKPKHSDIWSFRPGTLTIVDLSCPFVDESAACAMFNMCLGIFLESRGDVGRIIALDEAHKVRSPLYITSSS